VTAGLHTGWTLYRQWCSTLVGRSLHSSSGQALVSIQARRIVVGWRGTGCQRRRRWIAAVVVDIQRQHLVEWNSPALPAVAVCSRPQSFPRLRVTYVSTLSPRTG